MFVQAFVHEFPIEALNEGVLDGVTGLDKLQLNTV
jgi:hypothetical protein